jgi:hypothetical protein
MATNASLHPFNCPLTDSQCTEGGLCSPTVCVMRQRENDLETVRKAQATTGRARITRDSVKVQKVRPVVDLKDLI